MPNNRRIKFSLRFALAAMTLVCVVVGYYCERAHRMERRHAILVAHGASVRYSFEAERWHDSRWEWERRRILPPSRWLGIYQWWPAFFSNIEEVNGLKGPLPGAVRETIAELPDLLHLDVFDADFNDEDLRRLTCLPKLRWLSCRDTLITDAGIVELRRAKNLRYLDIGRTRVTGPGLLPLASLKHLRNLHISDHQCELPLRDGSISPVIAAEALEELKRQRRGQTYCKVSAGRRPSERVVPQGRAILHPIGMRPLTIMARHRVNFTSLDFPNETNGEILANRPGKPDH